MKKERRHELQKNELAQWGGAVGRPREAVRAVRRPGPVVGGGGRRRHLVVEQPRKRKKPARQAEVAELTDPFQQRVAFRMRALEEIPNFETSQTKPFQLTTQEREQIQTEVEQLQVKFEEERLASLETLSRTGDKDSLARRMAALAAGDAYLGARGRSCSTSKR